MADVAGLVDLQQLQKDLARASFLALRGEQWTVARRSYLEAGEEQFGRNHFLREDGSRGPTAGSLVALCAGTPQSAEC